MKHINSVDNVENLRALVRHDLRDLGIKVPKPKKAKRAAARCQQDINKSSIFGNYLATVHCSYIPDCGYVAKFLVDAAEIIKTHIDDEGIFRKSGAVSRQKELRQQLDCGKGLVGANVHDVTALVKQFFRELPEPLFTSTYHDTFVRCYQMEDEEISKKAILLLCLLLPGEHISTLRFTMKLLSCIAQHCSSNKMDSTNLAVVLAPNIMHVNSKSETMKSCEEKLLQVQTSVVDMLIKHADEVGMVSLDLVENTAFMSEVFSTDDELDASEDNLEDTHEKKRKDKKRKRSGSFQGFVSSIAQSITKWRRSTDGKTNVSALSQTSYNSHVNSSHTHGNENSEDTSKRSSVHQASLTDATPVVRRKKKGPGTEGRAFSASKKQAILNQLPQHSALASTPFTPATGVKRLDLNSVKKGYLETPSMPPRPNQCTPRHSMKTPRKKISLFSPASTTKKKRYSSTTNLSLQSTAKKEKSRGIFKRLSGSKGDQMFPPLIKKDDAYHQIGQRLASPTSSYASTTTIDSVCSKTSGKNITDVSAIGATAQTSSFSTSLCEQSVLSNFDDETHSLNDGFIAGSDDREVDISRIMSEPVLSGAFNQGEYVRLGDVCPRGTLSDTMIMNRSQFETPRLHNRSYSLNGTLDESTRKSSLRRGQPNSVKTGLLQGDHREVQKLRRSFGLDKSDISYPVNMQHMIDDGQYVHLDDSFNDYLDTNSHDQSYVCTPASNDVEMKEEINSADKMQDQNDVIEATENMETSKINLNNCIETDKLDEDACDFEDGMNIKKTLAQQKQESKDSLLSQTSSVISPITYIKDREMTRSISADSGKGSMCEEPMEDGTDEKSDSISNSVFDLKEVAPQTHEISNEEGKSTEHLLASGSKSFLENTQMKYGSACKKSLSTHDLMKEVSTPTPTRVCRSQSLLEGSFRRNNIKPNLQISAETHKLLARAGYISEQKAEKPNEDFDDFAVPGNLKFPVIKQAENINPRRESIIALQKNNAGHVKNNILQFNKISDTKSEDDKFVSPLRFPNSTSRKRGMSPFRLARKDSDSDYFMQAINASLDTSFGTARVPISTQLIKPSDQAALNGAGEKGFSLKRKPSIYYAEKEATCKLRNLRAGMLGTESSNCTIMEEDEGRGNTSADDSVSNPQLEIAASDDVITGESDVSVFISDNEEKTRLFDGKAVELNMSLQETIISVCTPRSEKLKQITERTDAGKENLEENLTCKMPEIKPAILTTPLTLEKISMRTAANKMPLEAFKISKSPRSPIKPLKRLGSSPHSPRSRAHRSPALVKNRRSLLSSMPSQIEDMNNL